MVRYICLDLLQIPDPFFLFPYFINENLPKQLYWLQIIEKGMASSRGTTLQLPAETAAILENLEDAYPQPTLRLRLQNQGEMSSEEIERGATEALEKLLKELEQVNTRTSKGIIMKFSTGSRWKLWNTEGLSEEPGAWEGWEDRWGAWAGDSVTATEKLILLYRQALDNFRRAMPVLREMMQEQSNITADLLERVSSIDSVQNGIGLWFFEKVKCYLIESWKMMRAGSSEEEMKKFRRKQRKEASEHFDKRVADLKDRMREKAIEFTSDWKEQQQITKWCVNTKNLWIVISSKYN